MPAIAPPEFVLDPIKPDFDALYQQLALEFNKVDSWNALITSGTGIALMRFLASVGSFNQFGIARALQESLPSTARVPSSIYHIMRMLNVHVMRKRSGSLTATLTRTGVYTTSLSIPARTVFSVGTGIFYNKEDLVFPAGVLTRDVTLYQGEPVSETVASSGEPYQRFSIGDPFNSSDDDVWAIDSTGNSWKSTRQGLHELTSIDRQFQEYTLPNGKIELWFGNGTFGALLPPGNVQLGYIRVQNAFATSTPIPVGTSLAVVGFAVQGVTTSNSSLNEDERDVDFYKIMGPSIGAAKDRAVTRNDYRAACVEYPGVIDAVVRGQKELNPSDVRFMNIVAVTLLTTSVWTDSAFNTFKRYLEVEKGIATVIIIRKDPAVIPIDLSLQVRVFNRANIAEITNKIQTVVANFFKPKLGSLGALYQPSDLLVDILQNTTDDTGRLIDYVNIVYPTEPIQLPKTSYAQLRDLTLDVSYTQRNVSIADIYTTGL